jgi:hypothetical protein
VLILILSKLFIWRENILAETLPLFTAQARWLGMHMGQLKPN